MDNRLAAMSDKRAGAATATAGRLRKDSDAVGLYKAAADEGRRRVDDQVAELDAMRTRCVQFLALTVTATAFLVGNSLSGADRDWLFYLLAGLGTFLAFLALLLSLSVLLGRKRLSKTSKLTWRFRLSGAALVGWIEHEVPSPPSEAAFTRALVQEFDEMHEHNDSRLQFVRKVYTSAISVGFSSVLVWTTLIWSRA